jgi:ubiquinol-cytochrome c reductase cytochrome b subunit
VLFSAAAFSGYMLPWGQMSYWAAQVITSLFSGVPIIGDALVVWIRGDFAVADATLTRFYMLHVLLLPLLIIAVIVVHFYSLRVPHVGNESGEEIDFDKEGQKYKAGLKKESKVIPFWPLFLSKDFAVVSIFMVFFSYLVCFHFNFALDPINFEPANAMKTPAHIYPEWYFLWSYEVLRGFFFDVGPMAASDIGLLAFGFANVAFFLLPFLDKSKVVAPAHERKKFFIWFWILVADMIILSVYGKLPPTGMNAWVGFVAAMVFIGLFVSLPFITKGEQKGGAK